MQALIIDCFSSSASGRKKFDLFCKKIKALLKKYSFDGKIKYFIQKKETLDRFIYENDTQFCDPDSIKRFNLLDLIFVDGEDNILPWDPEFAKVFLLIKMVFATGKYLFASGPFSFFVSYICFTGGRKVNVLNKDHNFYKEILYEFGFCREDQSASLYDPATGDIYQYNTQYGEWSPICNSGIINTNSKLRPHILPPCLSRNNFKDLNFSSSIYDTECIIQKQYGGHYLISNLPSLFKVPISSKYMILNKPSLYPLFVIGQDLSTPLIFQYKNILCLQFHISESYRDTLTILDLYISHSLEMIQSEYRPQFDPNQVLVQPKIQYEYKVSQQAKLFTSRATPLVIKPSQKAVNLFGLTLSQQPLRILDRGHKIENAFRVEKEVPKPVEEIVPEPREEQPYESLPHLPSQQPGKDVKYRIRLIHHDKPFSLYDKYAAMEDENYRPKTTSHLSRYYKVEEIPEKSKF